VYVVSVVVVLTTNELSERRSKVADSPRIQSRVPGRVEVRQHYTDVDEMARHVAVGTEEQHSVDRVQRQPRHYEHSHDDADAFGRPSLARRGKAIRYDGRSFCGRPHDSFAVLDDGGHRHQLHRHLVNLAKHSTS